MIRVRIAPSPTGYLHIGTARTALFNYLYGRAKGGQFILRIEDTDTGRSETEFETDIIEGLKWLGLDWDEGPDVGGPYGPYRQSERTERYKPYLEQLLANNHLYHCYCTEEELQQERESQLFAKQPPIYSGKCSNLSEEVLEQYKKEGRRYVLRFKVPAETITIHDAVRGTLSFDTGLIGDIVIAKDLDTPLYNFVVVADDHDMKITHVIRGEDHISNTPKQIMIARALGFELPEYTHLPLILNQDRSKLSKRQNKVSLLEYRNEGYLPEALVNFMVLMGWNPGGDKEIFTEEELKAIFDIKDVNKSGAVFDLVKLDWINSHYIKEKDLDELTDLSWHYFVKAGYAKQENGGTIGEREYIKKVIALERTRVKKLSELPENIDFFFNEPLVGSSLLLWKEMTSEQVKSNLLAVKEAVEAISESEFETALEEKIRTMITDKGLKNGEVLWPMRTALTGREKSPSPFEVAQVLGKDTTIKRLEKAIKSL